MAFSTWVQTHANYKLILAIIFDCKPSSAGFCARLTGHDWQLSIRNFSSKASIVSKRNTVHSVVVCSWDGLKPAQMSFCPASKGSLYHEEDSGYAGG